MKKLLFALLLLFFLSKGGMDKADIEDLSLRLIVGIDVDENGNLVVSASSPVFDKEARIKEEEFISPGITLWDARSKSDQSLMGLAVSGKIQEFLIGKRIMAYPGWFRLMEPLMREPKNSVRARMVMVDGPVADVIRYKPEDKPRLPLYLTKLIDTANYRNVTVKSTLQQFWNEDLEKGKTACMTELRKDGRLIIAGTALVDENGIYRLSIGPEETKLLRMLQHETKGDFSFTFHARFEPDGPPIAKDAYSFTVERMSIKTKTAHADDNFKFDVTLKLRVVLTERLFYLDMIKETGKLEHDMALQFQERLERLVRKCQSARIDPVGFGLYARAYEYQHWKQVRDQWGEALSKADVRVNVKVHIVDRGLVN